MLQKWRWNKKKSYNLIIPLLFLFFTALLSITIYYNELGIPIIRRRPIQSPVVLDKFTVCNATVQYSGRTTLGWKWSEWNRKIKSNNLLENGSEECDVFSGKWIFDNSSFPLYHESDCPYMLDHLACQKYGRSDLDYQYWRWKPHGCNLKRLNASEIWEKLRDKRLMFVGDSLNRGQWLSMVCLLQSVIPSNRRSMSPYAHLTVFRAEDYNATIELLWAPLLVDSNSDDLNHSGLRDRIIRPDSAARHLSKWADADILIFNTYLWWRQSVKLLWSNEQDGVCEELDGLRGMELAMNTWANWVDQKVDPRKKKVFFVTMSPTHLWKREWAPGREGNCYNERRPIDNETYWGSGSDLAVMGMVEKVLARVRNKVRVVNITQLSEYRKDGHPSIHRKFYHDISLEELSRPETYSDCNHWCLPGVPDVWNQLLFQFL